MAYNLSDAIGLAQQGRKVFWEYIRNAWSAGMLDTPKFRFAYERMTGQPITATDIASKVWPTQGTA